jgi:hypothetical protein
MFFYSADTFMFRFLFDASDIGVPLLPFVSYITYGVIFGRIMLREEEKHLSPRFQRQVFGWGAASLTFGVIIGWTPQTTNVFWPQARYDQLLVDFRVPGGLPEFLLRGYFSNMFFCLGACLFLLGTVNRYIQVAKNRLPYFGVSQIGLGSMTYFMTHYLVVKMLAGNQINFFSFWTIPALFAMYGVFTWAFVTWGRRYNFNYGMEWLFTPKAQRTTTYKSLGEALKYGALKRPRPVIKIAVGARE